jgi:signal transduction histidine kinase
MRGRGLAIGFSWVVAVAVGVVGAGIALVLVAGRAPGREERMLVVGALVGIVVASSLLAWLRPRLERGLLRVLHRDRAHPEDLALAFSGRMSRAIPLDELVLQAAESMRGGLRLRAVEVWRLVGDVLTPWLGDPDLHRPPVPLGGVAPAAVVQAGLSGHGWMQVWLPAMLAGREDSYVRLAPMASAGELQGVVVVERGVDADPFTPEEERAVAEIARQLGVVLHNAQLDSALQASLDEVRRQAEEIKASRSRIVAAADQARRQIERNLHDGAQQHVVALGIKAKLARTVLDRDPAKAAAILEELGADVDDTLQELRDLAHGIYPPLLADQGLAAALGAAARRAVLPTTVEAGELGRYAPEAEATVYFCTLEALQNAGKYAGEGASVSVEVREEDGALVTTIRDDGAGFDVRGKGLGAGFTNMLDRLGALGGSLRVESAPGRGTVVSTVVPASPVP